MPTTKKTDEQIEHESKKKQNSKELELLCLLADNKTKLPEIAQIIKQEYFETPEYRDVFDSMLKNEKGLNDKINSVMDYKMIEHANKLVASVGETIKDVAKKVKENYYRRKINITLGKAKRKSLNTDSEMLIGSIKSELESINSQLDEKQDSSIVDLVDQALIEMKEYSDNKKRIEIPPSFKNLGEITKGIFPHHIWTIGGHSGTGKSFFSLQLVSDLMLNNTIDKKCKISVVIFSTENSAIDNIYRIIGSRTAIDFIDIKTNNLTDEQKETVSHEMKVLRESRLFIYDKIFDVNQLSSIICMHKLRNECDLVLIDYIQNLNMWEKDIFTQMSKVALTIQQTALKNEVSIINVSQLSDNESRETGDKMMSFKGAGEIKNITDVGIWLQQGISPKIRDKFSSKYGDGIENPLMYLTDEDGRNRMVDKEDNNFITAYVNKVRHAQPGVAIFNFFTKECRSRNRYLWRLESKMSDEDAVDLVNKLG